MQDLKKKKIATKTPISCKKEHEIYRKLLTYFGSSTLALKSLKQLN